MGGRADEAVLPPSGSGDARLKQPIASGSCPDRPSGSCRLICGSADHVAGVAGRGASVASLHNVGDGQVGQYSDLIAFSARAKSNIQVYVLRRPFSWSGPEFDVQTGVRPGKLRSYYADKHVHGTPISNFAKLGLPDLRETSLRP